MRFSKPVVVPDDDIGAVLTVSAAPWTEKLEDGRVVVGLTATVGENKVLAWPKATGQLRLTSPSRPRIGPPSNVTRRLTPFSRSASPRA